MHSLLFEKSGKKKDKESRSFSATSWNESEDFFNKKKRLKKNLLRIFVRYIYISLSALKGKQIRSHLLNYLNIAYRNTQSK